MFDVVVYNEKSFQNTTYRSGLRKSEAKKLVKELREKGLKAQLKSSKGNSVVQEIFIPEQEDE